ncbi:unnamed protein product [Pleuronectes platessa]|uniref:Uncharacterized protein n=1 Tax=Pleuronectes platessa TaxID=8262 RepID=A0A9N7VAY4_PLEPL|nr:unnamed protein product [Pleuronectes platessa]
MHVLHQCREKHRESRGSTAGEKSLAAGETVTSKRTRGNAHNFSRCHREELRDGADHNKPSDGEEEAVPPLCGVGGDSTNGEDTGQRCVRS